MSKSQIEIERSVSYESPPLSTVGKLQSDVVKIVCGGVQAVVFFIVTYLSIGFVLNFISHFTG